MNDALRRRIAAVVAACLLATPAWGQGGSRGRATEFTLLDPAAPPPALAARVSLALDDVTVAAALEAIGREAGLGLVFDRGARGLERRVTVKERGATAAAALARVLDDGPLQAMVSPGGQVVVVPRRAQPRAGTVSGLVSDSVSRAPLAGARVELMGTRFTAVAGDDGRFTLGRVPPGTYDLRVVQLGFAPNVTRIRVVDGEEMPAVDVVLARVPTALSAMVVTPGYFGLLRPTVASRQTMTRQQLEATPQIGEDVFRALGRLPGMAGTDISAQLHLRGAPQDELYVTLDGVELVEPFHLKDFDNAMSIVDVKAIGGLELTSGGFSAEYGDHLTGVFNMRSVEPRTDRTHGAAGISLMNGRANVDGGFANGRGGWLVSARRGYLDVALRFTDVSQNFKPRYGDVFAKVQYDLPWGGRVAAHTLYALDQLHYVDSSDGNVTSRYGSGYAWLTWDDGFGTRLRQRTVASVTGLTWRRDGVAYDDFDERLVAANVGDRRRYDALGLRQDWTLDATSWMALRWGVDARRETADYDYASWTRTRRPD
ncbi:MAG: TonB-dependent receptor, partial [Gemmatirosa sp.]|nr:TonB-dependent receptor [Gemmatirosa sp.]